LSRAWSAGSGLYAALGRSDAAYGAGSFGEALAWLSTVRKDRPIAEMQFWGHGKWGRLFLGKEALDRGSLSPGRDHHAALAALRERLTADALIWFRTCETFGADAGRDFACAWTDFFGRPAAGHTFVIGYWQSGLHLLRPGVTPHWPTGEGLVQGSPARPERAAPSTLGAPNTITCFSGRVPQDW
jgi:hypothetical protein